MLEPINFSNAKCIVEFGPGTGSITKELLNKMPKDALLLVFEINKEFRIINFQLNGTDVRVNRSLERHRKQQR